MQQDGDREPAIKKLLAKSRGYRERKIGKQLYGRLRQDSLRQGLKRAPPFYGNSPHAPEVRPLQRRDGRGADNRGNEDPGSALHRETELRGRESVRPGAPPYDRHRKPLKGNGRGVKPEPFHGRDVRHGEEFLYAHPPAPRQKQAQYEKNQPDVPGHPPIRTLSLSAAQVSIVPLCASANGGSSL